MRTSLSVAVSLSIASGTADCGGNRLHSVIVGCARVAFLGTIEAAEFSVLKTVTTIQVSNPLAPVKAV